MASADFADRPASAAEALADLDGRGPVVPAPDPAEDAAAKTAVLAAPPPPPERPPPASERFGLPEGRDRARLVAISGLAVVALIALLVIVTSGGGGDVPTRDQLRAEGLRPANESGGAAGRQDKAQGAGQSAAGPAASAGGGSSDADEADIGDGVALNDEGFALMQSGDYEGAVEVLRRAVDAFPAGTSDINYAYALYNLGHALRLGGDPEAAIPVLEERLRIPNQTDVVRRELEAARAEAD
jgi:tetratricopeptide (TPR) repeat protein